MTAENIYDFLVKVQKVPEEDVTIDACLELIGEFSCDQDIVAAEYNQFKAKRRSSHMNLVASASGPQQSLTVVPETQYSRKLRRASEDNVTDVYLTELGFTAYLQSMEVQVYDFALIDLV